MGSLTDVIQDGAEWSGREIPGEPARGAEPRQEDWYALQNVNDHDRAAGVALMTGPRGARVGADGIQYIPDADYIDCFKACYDRDPETNPACADGLKLAFMGELIRMDEESAAPRRAVVSGRTAPSLELAGIVFDELKEARRKFAEECQRAQTHKFLAEANGALEDGDEGMTPEEKQKMIACAAARDAEKVMRGVAEEIRQVAGGFGMGPAEELGEDDTAEVMALWKKMREKDELRRILALTRMLQTEADSAQRTKTSRGPGSYVGVEIGRDLNRALRMEMVRASDPDLEDDFLIRFFDGRLLCWDQEQEVPAGRGPIIVTIDFSYSMQGPVIPNDRRGARRIDLAKALGLSLMYVARQQGRAFRMASFSGSWAGPKVLAVEADGRPDPKELMQFLERGPTGGTDMDVPIAYMHTICAGLSPEQIAEPDFIVITDGAFDPSNPLVDRFKQWKEQVRGQVFGLLTVARGDHRPLLSICDRAWSCANDSTNQEGIREILRV